MSKRRILIAFVVLMIWAPWVVSAADHFIDSSCTDNGTGHAGNCAESAGAAGAWNSFASANSHSYATSDDIYLKCGSTFTSQRLAPALTGTSNDLSVIGAYYSTGTIGVQGARPIISGNTRTYPAEGSYTALVDITSGRDYVHITNLNVVGSGGLGIQVSGTSTNQAVGNRVTNCYVASTYRHGIRINTNSHYSIIDGNEVTDTGWSRFNSATWPAGICSTGSNPTPANSHNTISNNYVYLNHGEGIDLIKGVEYDVVEYNTVVNNRSGLIYMDRAVKYCTIRYNLVYGYMSGAPFACSTGISLNDEGTATYAGSEGNKIYGNYIANTSAGLSLRSQHEDGLFKDNEVYNNTLVDNTVQLNIPDNVGAKCSGSYIRNNVMWCTGGRACTQATIPNTHTGLTLSHNLWSSEPEAAAQGAGDPTYAAPQLQKLSGWQSFGLGGIDAVDFGLRSTSTAIDAGYDIGDSYDDALDANQSSFAADSWTLLDQDDNGDGWEIGADVFSDSAPPEGLVTPINLAAGTPNASICALTWTASTGATGYRIQYGPTSTFPDTGAVTVETTGTSVTLYTLTANTGYSARVLAFNDTEASAYSAAVTFTTSDFSQGDILSLANFTSMTGWTVSGGETWTNGACTDDSDTLYCHAERTVATTIPDELTLSFTVDVDAQPDTFATGGGTGRFVGVYFDSGTRRLGFYQADDGLYISVGTAYTLIAGTSALTDTSAHTWTLLLRQNPSGSTPWLANIYSGETLQVSDYACGRTVTGTTGSLSVDVRGTAADNATGTFSNLYISSGHSPPVAVPVHMSTYYAVDDCGDVKTGSPTITIADGIGTFSADQTSSDIIPGFQVDFGAGNTQCYVAEDLSFSRYRLVTPLGAPCAAVTDQTVNYFRPPFTTLSGAESGITGAGYLTSGDLGTLDVDVNIYLGSVTVAGNFAWNAFTNTSAQDCWRLITPRAVDGFRKDSTFTLAANNTYGMEINSNHLRLSGGTWQNISTNGDYDRMLSIVPAAGTVLDIEISNAKFLGYQSNTGTRHEGLLLAAGNATTGSVLKIWNCVFAGFKGGTNNYGINVADADVETYVYRTTLTDCAVGMYAGGGTPILKNVLSTATDPYGGTFDTTLSDHNLSSGTDAPGTNETESATVTFYDAANRNYKLHPTSDAVAGGAGADLSTDAIIPITHDMDGNAYLVNGEYSVGAYASPGTYSILSSFTVDISKAIGETTVTVTRVSPTNCDSFTVDWDFIANPGTTTTTDADCSDYTFTHAFAPRATPYVIKATASKTDYTDVSITLDAVKVIGSSSAYYYGSGSGCPDADFTPTTGIDWELNTALPLYFCGNNALDLSNQELGAIDLRGSGYGKVTSSSGHIFDAKLWEPGGPVELDGGAWSNLSLGD